MLPFLCRLGLRRFIEWFALGWGAISFLSCCTLFLRPKGSAFICDQHALGDEHHMLFECAATQAARASFVQLFPPGCTWVVYIICTRNSCGATTPWVLCAAFLRAWTLLLLNVLRFFARPGR